jgi:tRNA-2-methylthio-N6-dimethylallyladenosine synthase
MMSSQPDAPPGKFYIRTFGCQMNSHDSEHISGVLTTSGLTIAETLEDADIVIFNTCCVRESAEDRVWGNLSTLAARPDGPVLVAVCGCMAARHGVEILRRFPGVRLVFGLDAVERLPELLRASRGSPVCDLGDIASAVIDGLPASRRSLARAWVPVSHGCDNRCAYCVVPSVRGPQRSRPPDEVVEEVTRLAGEGVLEVTLLGQNVNSYGRDLAAGEEFSRLLERVASVPGIRRVKFETSHPRDLNDGILEEMSARKTLCEYLHLPVQSGSDRVLEAMNRGYTRYYYLERASRARELVEGLALTTDMIVGFPGETEGDFNDTLDLVRRVEFDAAYTFMYSPREGTPAFDMDDDVPAGVKHRRLEELARLQGEITSRRLSMIVGRDVEVMVEGPARSPGDVVGRTRGHQVVVLPAADAPVDSLVRAVISGSGGHSLRGEVREVLTRRGTSES